jgi:hypothetical protein
VSPAVLPLVTNHIICQFLVKEMENLMFQIDVSVDLSFHTSIESCRSNCKYNHLPSGSGKEAAYGGNPTREMPTSHDCGIS